MKLHKVKFKYSSYTTKNINNKNARWHHSDLNALLCLFASLMPEENVDTHLFVRWPYSALLRMVGVLIFSHTLPTKISKATLYLLIAMPYISLVCSFPLHTKAMTLPDLSIIGAPLHPLKCS